MTQDIKEKVLKHEKYLRDYLKVLEEQADGGRIEMNEIHYHKLILRNYLKGKQETLAEVDKVIDEEIKKEQDCADRDEYEEQLREHTNQIEMANKIKQKLGIK